MRSIFGECPGNVRSTPPPKLCLRTVKVSRLVEPWRLMTVPSNTCTRWREPSMTRKWTLTVSPALNAGMSSRSCSRSRLSMTLIRVLLAARHARAGARQNDGQHSKRPRGAAGGGRRPRSPLRRAGRRQVVLAPSRDGAVVAGAEHLGHLVAEEGRGARVVRMLHAAAELLRERLGAQALGVAEGALQTPGDGVDDRHRRDLAAGEDEGAERHLVVGEDGVHALVKALVPPAEQHDLGLGGQLAGDGVAEGTAPRGQDDDAGAVADGGGRLAVDRLEGGG